MPERPSSPCQEIPNPWLYQPFESGERPGCGVTAGAVSSIEMPLCVSLAPFPAASVQVPVADWLAPSVATVRVTVAGARERASAQLHVSVTGPLFQPAAFAGVRETKAIVGGVAS